MLSSFRCEVIWSSIQQAYLYLQSPYKDVTYELQGNATILEFFQIDSVKQGSGTTAFVGEISLKKSMLNYPVKENPAYFRVCY